MNKFEFVRKTILHIGLLWLIFHLSSCIKEDISNCDFFLQFSYDYNLANEDWFAEQVEEVKVYLFDKEGRYVQTLCDSIPAIALPGYKMKIPYEMKGYSAVVWAGRTNSYQLPTMNIGDSRDKLQLLYTPFDMKSNKKIDDLWHSGPTTLLFPDNGGTTQIVSLVRNTNDFFVQLVSSQGESILANHSIKIKSANGSYNHVNQFLPTNQPLSYAPFDRMSQTVQLRTLRLVEDDNITLSITDSEGRSISINGKNEINLIEYLLLNKPVEMTNQEYLDRRYIWNISLTVDNHLALSITINGWVVWFHETEI